jgi:hypothetical protein
MRVCGVTEVGEEECLRNDTQRGGDGEALETY